MLDEHKKYRQNRELKHSRRGNSPFFVGVFETCSEKLIFSKAFQKKTQRKLQQLHH
jgi:hypothetical protein